MSISVCILPATDQKFTWSDLKQQILHFADPEALRLMGQHPNILYTKDKIKLKNEEVIEAPNSFCFDLSYDNTLTLHFEKHVEHQEEMYDYIEDFGRNLNPDFVSSLINQWSEIGCSYMVESWGGRAKGEGSVFKATVSAVSKLTDGLIVIEEEEIFSLPPGIYKLEQFQQSEPLFGREIANYSE
jgi:hypothetical protein